MAKTDILLMALGLIIVFKLVKEIAYIRLYAFIIGLKAQGKLVPENDPAGIADKTAAELKKNSSRWI